MTARAGGSPILRQKVYAHRDAIYLRKEVQIGPLTIWHVNGIIVRNFVFIDFTEGGNSWAYAWMPPHEIWLDHDVNEAEIKFVQLHELHEYNKMARGLGYEKAHDSANVVELEARRHPTKWGTLWQTELRILNTPFVRSKLK